MLSCTLFDLELQTSKMSAILSVDDLNDFISPGVACIKPVEIKKTNDTGKARIEISMDGVPTEITDDGQISNLEKAQISLSDCLACSGCITSAESVLVSLQSHEELLKSIQSEEGHDKIYVVSISHQSRVSLAGAYGISIDEVDAKLQDLFINTLKFKYMVGMEIGRAISLQASYDEMKDLQNSRNDSSPSGAGAGPVLCSSCPGWTCYVEKTHPHIIPYLSKVKSPQQITGTILKELISRDLGISKDKIYHLSVMPCFDKKLEAARPDFGSEEDENPYRDVDCVITAKEIVQLLISENMAFESLKAVSTNKLDALAPKDWPAKFQWTSHQGSSSGGYLDFIIQQTQALQPNPTQIQVLPGKNSDITEYRVVLESDPSQILFRGARMYGFRNIQNLVRKLKTKGGNDTKTRLKMVRGRVTTRKTTAAQTLSDPTQYDYVEVMACPGGCVNGGGQIGMPESQTPKQWKDELEILYDEIEDFTKQLVQKDVSTNYATELGNLAYQWVNFLWTGDTKRLLNVEYHAVENADEAAALDPSLAPLALGTKW